jgi:glutaredoxin domain-containing cysteine-rich protein 1
MKGIMKGKLLKKLKSIRPIGYLKPDRILQVYAAPDGNVESHPENPSLKAQTELICKEMGPKKVVQSGLVVEEPEVVDVAELMRDLEDEDMEFDEDIENKENIGPPKSKNSLKSEPEFRQNRASEASESRASDCRQKPLSEIDISSFRRPELNSGSLFDPNLLAAFEQAVKEHMRISEAERRGRTEQESLEQNEEEEPPSKARRVEDDLNEEDPLFAFEEKCPPGGTDAVILYTTTLRGIRKTFEECNSIRFLLESFRVLFFERDVSMHMEFKDELWRVLDGTVKPLPPRLFIKGRYIGGAEEVLVLHEQGKLRPLFQGIPINQSDDACQGCAGFRFVLCFNCNGSHRVVADDGKSNQCEVCNENGLIICPYCC